MNGSCTAVSLATRAERPHLRGVRYLTPCLTAIGFLLIGSVAIADPTPLFTGQRASQGGTRTAREVPLGGGASVAARFVRIGANSAEVRGEIRVHDATVMRMRHVGACARVELLDGADTVIWSRPTPYVRTSWHANMYEQWSRAAEMRETFAFPVSEEEIINRARRFRFALAGIAGTHALDVMGPHGPLGGLYAHLMVGNDQNDAATCRDRLARGALYPPTPPPPPPRRNNPVGHVDTHF